MGNDNFKLGYGWFSKAVSLVDEGANRTTSGTGLNIQYVDPTPQRKGRADDIAFRSMPAHAQTRYAAGLEKMSVNGIPATFGEVAKILDNPLPLLDIGGFNEAEVKQQAANTYERMVRSDVRYRFVIDVASLAR